ncbi:MAG: sigma-54-dependent Fis family transcriptional regulator [bacterium]|nr:sigma-54-dependent Fis family transcriptional regulator [bacterium]
MKEKYKILIVEDEKVAGRALYDNLKKQGFVCTLFDNAEEALLHFREAPVDLVLLDYKLPGMSGEEFFRQIKELNPLTPVIFMTAYSSVEKAVKLLRMGAYNYLNKPIEMEELIHNIRQALEKVALYKENKRLHLGLKEKFSFDNYIFNAERMQEVMNLVLRSADSSANILITGESGTGKEAIANILHYYSRRKDNTFVKVNLAALPETLIEAELFGSVKGAYTGSVDTRAGKFEEAHKGTLFLDEIGELPMDIQVKLLRALQEREVIKLGSNSPVKVDIRLIVATNKNLKQLVREGKFREDLFFRLNVINIELPPLRERREDIKLLIDLFIKKFNKREGKEIGSISKDALNMLVKYTYPGNIRELENIIERAVVLARSDVLTLQDLPVFIENEAEDDWAMVPGDSVLSLPERLSIIEKKIISDTLKKVYFNQSKAAQELGISESGLRYKIQALKIKK